LHLVGFSHVRNERSKTCAFGPISPYAERPEHHSADKSLFFPYLTTPYDRGHHGSASWPGRPTSTWGAGKAGRADPRLPAIGRRSASTECRRLTAVGLFARRRSNERRQQTYRCAGANSHRRAKLINASSDRWIFADCRELTSFNRCRVNTAFNNVQVECRNDGFSKPYRI